MLKDNEEKCQGDLWPQIKSGLVMAFSLRDYGLFGVLDLYKIT